MASLKGEPFDFLKITNVEMCEKGQHVRGHHAPIRRDRRRRNRHEWLKKVGDSSYVVSSVRTSSWNFDSGSTTCDGTPTFFNHFVRFRRRRVSPNWGIVTRNMLSLLAHLNVG